MLLLFLIIKHTKFEVKWMLLIVSCIKGLNGEPTLGTPSTLFKKNLSHFCLLKNEISTNKRFSCVKTKTNSNFSVKNFLEGRSNHFMLT